MMARARRTKPKLIPISRPRARRGYSLIELSALLVKQARAKLDTRDLDLETYIEMHLRSMLRAPSPVISLKDTMPFGKYRDELVENVVRADPRYVSWLINEGNGSSSSVTSISNLLDEIHTTMKPSPVLNFDEEIPF